MTPELLIANNVTSFEPSTSMVVNLNLSVGAPAPAPAQKNNNGATTSQRISQLRIRIGFPPYRNFGLLLANDFLTARKTMQCTLSFNRNYLYHAGFNRVYIT